MKVPDAARNLLNVWNEASAYFDLPEEDAARESVDEAADTLREALRRWERVAELKEALAALMVGLVRDTRPGQNPELHDAVFAVQDAAPLVAELHELLAELERHGEPVSRGKWRMPRP